MCVCVCVCVCMCVYVCVCLCGHSTSQQKQKLEVFHVKPKLLKVTSPSALENCMKASDKLAPHIIPFLLEKLGSSVMKSRIGACKTLKSCIMSFGTTAIEGFLQVRNVLFGLFVYH